jgi:hypothetical protein
MTAQMHKDNPDYMAVRFDTEMRADAQMDPIWGIDNNRFQAFNVSDPTQIYDRISNELSEMLDDGMPLKLIVIDSLQGMKGVKRMGKDSVADHLMGDDALTHGIGLKNILPIIRKHRIALICTSHIRANLDAGMYGPKDKMAGGYAQKHFFEFFVEVKKDGDKSSKIENQEVKDFRDNKEQIGHKIYVKMADTSLGNGMGRSGEFTLEYSKGLINVHEEIAQLSINLGVVERPNNRTYIFDGKSYTSKAEFLTAIKDNSELQKALLSKVMNKQSNPAQE